MGHTLKRGGEEGKGIKRQKKKVFSGDDIEQVTKRKIYENYILGEISLREEIPEDSYVQHKF